MENYERQNRLRDALRIRNMRQVELVEKTGIKKSSINNWLAQRWQPKQDSLMKMAKALDVSEMWLAGYDVPMERPIEQKINDTKVGVADRIYNDSEFLEVTDFLNQLSLEDFYKAKEMLYLLFKKA